MINILNYFLCYDNSQLVLSYFGNMGDTKKNINALLHDYRLPSLDVFATYPSFHEEGSPDYQYTAHVDFNELSFETRIQIAKIICKRHSKSSSLTSIDAILKEYNEILKVFPLILKCLEN